MTCAHVVLCRGSLGIVKARRDNQKKKKKNCPETDPAFTCEIYIKDSEDYIDICIII
jgi:hypothetical protein